MKIFDTWYVHAANSQNYLNKIFKQITIRENLALYSIRMFPHLSKTVIIVVHECIVICVYMTLYGAYILCCWR